MSGAGFVGGAVGDLGSTPITTPSQNVAALDYYANDVATSGIYFATTPNAFYDSVGNKTWLSYQRWDGSIRHGAVRVYDHAAKTYGPIFNMFGGTIVDDDHGVPAICMDDQGYVHAFGDAHATPMYYSYTTTARDPSTFVSYGTIGTTNTYPHPTFVPGAQVGKGTIYLFMRKTVNSDTSCPLVLNQITLNNGVPTVGAEIKVADFGANSRYYQGNHVKVGSIIWHVATRADYNDTLRQDVFLVGYDTATGNLVSASGVQITPASFPVSLNTFNSTFRIVNQAAGSLYGDIPSFTFDGAGNFVVLYVSGNTNSISFVSYNLYSLTVSPQGLVGTPTLLGTQKDRYDGFGAVSLPDGSVDAYYILLSNYNWLRGGDMWKARRSPAGVWGGAQLVLACEPYCAMDIPVAVLNATGDIRVHWTENAQPPSTGNTGGSADPTSGLGNGRMYAYGDSGFATQPFTVSTQLQAYLNFLGTGTPSLRQQKALSELLSVIVNVGAYSTLGLAGIQAAISSYPTITSAVSSLTAPNNSVVANALARYILNADATISVAANQFILTSGGTVAFNFTRAAPTDVDVSIDGSAFVSTASLASALPAPAAASVTVASVMANINGGNLAMKYTGVPPTTLQYQLDGAGPWIDTTNNITITSASGATNTTGAVGFNFNGVTPTNIDYSVDGGAFVTVS